MHMCSTSIAYVKQSYLQSTEHTPVLRRPCNSIIFDKFESRWLYYKMLKLQKKQIKPHFAMFICPVADEGASGRIFTLVMVVSVIRFRY